MAQRLFRIFVFAMLTIGLLGPSPSRADDQDKLRPTIAFTSTRDLIPERDIPPNNRNPYAAEIYLINPDVDPDDLPCTADPEEAPHCDLRRLTNNTDGDGFASLSPDGKRIVFDSNRLRDTSTVPQEPRNTSDLFLMKSDGKEQTLLTRGSTASWSPNGKQVAFHASASGTGRPINTDPGAATTDSDIFVINVGNCLDDVAACKDAGSIKRNLTNTTSDECDEDEPYAVEDNADWSPDGQQIAFTSHPCTDNENRNSSTTEIYVMKADGTGRIPLTHNDIEERAPNWSPDGTRIAFMCRPGGTFDAFQICVMEAKEDAVRTQLTSNNVLHTSPSWSPDGTKIAFDQADDPDDGDIPMGPRELWIMNADGTGKTQLTDYLGFNLFASWGVLRITGQGDGQVAASSTDRSANTVQGLAVDDGKADHGKQDKHKKDNGKKDKNDNQHKKGKGGGKRHR